MNTFTTQSITRIKGISDRRRLPRLGRIRLGFKIKKGDKEYPAELPFFLLPDEVAKVFGFKSAEAAVNRAKEMQVTRQDVLNFIRDNYWRLSEELKIMFPINDPSVVFPQALKFYGNQKGVKCIGDGERALRYDEDSKSMIEVPCPCENLRTENNPQGGCMQRAHLMFMIPQVSMGGVYQLTLSSYNSIVDINSGFDYITAMIGRFAMVMLTLRRVPIETYHADRKQIHYTLQLIFNVDVNMLDALRADTQRVIAQSQFILPAPEDVNPAMDKEFEVVYTVDEETEQEMYQPLDEPQEEKVETHFQRYERRIKNAKNLDELRTEWNDICNEVKENRANIKLTSAETKTLNVLVKQRKKELESATSNGIDVEEIISAISKTTTLDELDKIWDSVEGFLEGENKVKVMRARDKKAVQIKGLE